MATVKRDYYEVLQVTRTADGDTLKKSYRKLAMEFHPDRNQGNKDAETKFMEINEAYEVLRDDNKRALYDRHGHSAFEQGRGGGAGQGAGGFDFGEGFANVFEEMFGDIFGGGGGRGRGGQRATARGNDLRAELEITLDEAFKGAKSDIQIVTQVQCDKCEGTGAAKGSKPITCPTCNGAGKQRLQQGFFMVERTCGTCGGQGKVIEKPCDKCHGGGRVRRERRLEVTIPAGVEDGTRIRLSGEGEAGARGAPAGDLYVFLSVKPHKLFQRDGATLYCRVPVPFATAALGGEIEVPTIDGTRSKITITAGTQNGARFRVKGRGMSVLRAETRGDLTVEAYVEVPVKLNRKQQELLEEFAREADQKNHPETESFWNRVKDIWK